jgi:hypothetical protein
MSTTQLVQLVVIGELAMDQWRAQDAATNAEGRYHQAIQAYETQHGRLTKLLQKSDPAHDAARAFTAPQYKLLKQARRRVYALKVRMAKACAKMARISAARPIE